MVEFKIKFSKYDYFGILIPGILFLIFIIPLFPFELLLNLNNILSTLNNIQFALNFIIGIGIVVIAYIFGLIFSGIGRWIIEGKIIKKSMRYPSSNLFYPNKGTGNAPNEISKDSVKSEKKEKEGDEKKKRLFKTYKAPYSDKFINNFNDSFFDFFSQSDYSDEDKFKLCFTVVKEKCPITFSRMNTFIALYGLYRTLSITFVIISIIYLIYGIIIGNILLILSILFLPLLSLFCFSNYLKFLKAYSDEVFRTFYIYSIETKKRENIG